MSEPVSERTTLHRYAHRAAYDRADRRRHPRRGRRLPRGVPDRQGISRWSFPWSTAGHGDVVYLHGSAASRFFRRRPHPLGRDLHDRDLGRRPSGGPVHLQHRHQLPLGRHHRRRQRGDGPRGEAPGPRAHGRAHPPGPQPPTPARPPRRSSAAPCSSRLPLNEARPRSGPAGPWTTTRTTTFRSGPASYPCGSGTDGEARSRYRPGTQRVGTPPGRPTYTLPHYQRPGPL